MIQDHNLGPNLTEASVTTPDSQINPAKQIQETHTAYNFGTHYMRQSLNEKQYTWLHTDTLLSVKSYMLFFIQTLPRILCAGAISHVNFLDLFGPIAWVTNPIM